MSDDAPHYTGELRKGEEPGTVVGTLKDAWGWEIAITGTLVAGTATYALTGVLGAVPDSLRIETIDGVA